jgi:hypothetical protein
MEAGKDSSRTDDFQVDALKLDDDKADGLVPSADLALQHRYNVWAMMKQQMNNKNLQDLSETYQVANKIIANFASVS